MQLCTGYQPDLALLDVGLPGISGIDFARWLKSTLNVPFLFLSAFNDTETVNAAVELGALGYLVKPLDVLQVLPSIRTALQRAAELKQLYKSELDLGLALKTSRHISMAIGLLMQRFGTNGDETFEALRSYCRSERKPMRDVAELVVEHRQIVDLAPYLAKR
jgi:response regulator NasT